ncbi:superinfection immunity protein [Chromobacterium haemolyticum]|uniref:Superinfection immunity protein n=1 Tax=Chromobacterium haemolyticum TaxID=394935 RepID=A0A1W0D1X7_9NEIS|nr:superinfection immunity protein [Chromobacterium haemolyticum]OQS41016.1 hypothetical protein B0T45_09280 [Chromobacterium haemolyticum]
METFMLVFIGLFFYFIPAGVAHDRKHKSVGGIFILNLFLGWTFIGWVIALAWACGNTGRN